MSPGDGQTDTSFEEGGAPHPMLLLARATMEAQGPIPSFSDFGAVPGGNPWGANPGASVPGDSPWSPDGAPALTSGGNPWTTDSDVPAATAPLDAPSAGPVAVTLHFSGGARTFARTSEIQAGRFVYFSTEASLTLAYTEENGGFWEVATPSAGWCYRLHTAAATPAELVGGRDWDEASGGTIFLNMSDGDHEDE
mmetsp:Transcript_72592/g.117032  ORF Transcript_72592/g.117032 Transcript_72592/m.117032 type:complete len:195 (-) Transcript_72592:73-657(-)